MARTKTKHDYRDYPKGHIYRESGAKVGWLTYADRATAEQCAAAARHNARIQEALGFDFGYCAPGDIEERPVGGSGFRVCIP